jgi:two-component system, chemotaxis family, chemotaxis protein CheY
MQQIADARRILIVDDSSTSRMIVRRCFEIASPGPLIFYEAVDGAAALEFLHAHEVDLIVTDVNMPEMDGMTFVWKTKVSRRLQSIPILVLSSMMDEQLQCAFAGLGVAGFIQKPLSPAKVAELIEDR